MTAKETAKDLYTKLKAVFDGTPPAPQAAPPSTTAPAPTSAPAPTVYTLVDGTQIAIAQAGATPAPGDVVTIAGSPAPAGVLTLSDGTAITVDGTGTITSCVPGVPAMAATPAPAAAAPAPVVPVTQSAMNEHTEKFAVGDIESRVANLEIVAKGLVESEFGYQISANERLASQNQAIAIYETTLKTQTSELEAAKVTLTKYGETIKGLFELVEKLTELPVKDPVTLNGNKAEKFARVNDKEAKLDRIAAARAQALKEFRESK